MATKTPSKNPEGQKMKKRMDFELTEAEKAGKAELAAQGQVERNRLMAEFTKVKQEWKEKIEAQQAKIDTNLRCISEGKEEREVEVTAVKNFETFQIEYWHEGTMHESRDMKPDERQQDLFIVPDVKPADIAEARTKRKTAAEKKAAESDVDTATAAASKIRKDVVPADHTEAKAAAAEQETEGASVKDAGKDRSQQIRDVHRLETSRSTKRSSVDQPTDHPTH